MSRDLFQLNINSQSNLGGRNLRSNPDLSFSKEKMGISKGELVKINCWSDYFQQYNQVLVKGHNNMGILLLEINIRVSEKN